MTLVGKELREIARDGRAVAAAIIVLALIIGALTVGAGRVAEDTRRRDSARKADEQLWRNQGERNPHIAAHFGKYAVREMSPLALFDPGVTTYAGPAIWIEAHYQNPFSFRPADDATSLLRFGELAPSTLFQWLLPLLVIAIGFPMIAAERERGTLRHIASLGVSGKRIISAKTTALMIVIELLILGSALVAAIFGAARVPRLSSGELVRAGALAVTYTLYLGIFIAITIAVSARADTARTAVTILLAFWIYSTLVVPRLASEIASRSYPVPTSADFWSAIRHDIDRGMDGHNPRNARRKALEATMLKQYGVSRVEDLPINFEGFALEEGERYANEVFDRHYGALFETYRRRDLLQQTLSLASPLLAVRGLSMALAGSDVAHHHHFAHSTEIYRRDLQYFLNHDMTENALGVEFLEYKRGQSFWDSAPKFSYEPSSAGWALGRQPVASGMLGLWVLGAAVLLFASPRALEIPEKSMRPSRRAERSAETA